jgi:hypothetical protein
MIRLASVISILCGTTAMAEPNVKDAVAWDYDLKYVAAPSSIKADRILKGLESRLKNWGFHSLPIVRSNDFPLSHVDGIFSSTDFAKVIFVKFGIAPANKKYLGKLIKRAGTQWLYLGKAGDDENYSLYFSGFTKEELPKVLVQVDFIAEAKTQEGLESQRVPAGETASGSQQDQIGGGQPSAEGDGLRWTYGCVVGSFKGAWDATGGLVVGSAKLGYKAVVHPIDTATKFWDGVHQAWEVTRSFYSDFSTAAAKFYKGLDDLPPKLKGELSCQIVSMLGVGGLVGYFTLGAGAPAMIEKIAALFVILEATPQFASVLGPMKTANRVKSLAKTNTATAGAQATPGTSVAKQKILTKDLGLLESGTKEQKLATIAKIENTKLDDATIAKANPVEYNSLILSGVDKLADSVRAGDVEVQVAAMNALAKYGKANSGNYAPGVVGRGTLKAIKDLYQDYSLPDSVRKIAFEELNVANKSLGFESLPAFETSQALRAKDTVGFLGKTHKEIGHAGESAARRVESVFPDQPVEVKKQIYEHLIAGKGIPAAHQSEFVAKANLKNINSLEELKFLGFHSAEGGKSMPNVVIWSNDKGAQVIVHNPPFGSKVTPYSADDIVKMKEAILKNKRFIENE